MYVFAVDGSKFNLPGNDELREKFDPNSGLDKPGKGHYPQCLVTTVYDVFRRIPIARSVAPVGTSEREEFLKLLPLIPDNQLLVFDRGYPSYEMLKKLNDDYSGVYIFRCPATNSFPAIEQFLDSNKDEDIIFIKPSKKYLQKLSKTQRKQQKSLKVRIIKLISPDGEISVLLTNLFNCDKFPKEDIQNLYFRRWEVEVYYRDEKVTIEIEKFHSKTYNGIMQELFAVATMSVIARFLTAIADQDYHAKNAKPQFKHAVITFSNEIVILCSENPSIAIDFFKELLEDIARVRYYKSKKERKSQPRVCKKAINKWAIAKNKKLDAP